MSQCYAVYSLCGIKKCHFISYYHDPYQLPIWLSSKICCCQCPVIAKCCLYNFKCVLCSCCPLGSTSSWTAWSGCYLLVQCGKYITATSQGPVCLSGRKCSCWALIEKHSRSLGPSSPNPAILQMINNSNYIYYFPHIYCIASLFIGAYSCAFLLHYVICNWSNSPWLKCYSFQVSVSISCYGWSGGQMRRH